MILPDELIEGLANKYSLTKLNLTFGQYVDAYLHFADPNNLRQIRELSIKAQKVILLSQEAK